jgi:hypothetical protein
MSSRENFFVLCPTCPTETAYDEQEKRKNKTIEARLTLPN